MSSLKDKRSTRTNTSGLAAASTPAEIVIGQFVGISDDGAPLVDYPTNPTGVPVAAVATSRYDLVPIDAPVALMFFEGDRARPLALGVVMQPKAKHDRECAAASTPERLTFTAVHEIVFQCGRSSIVITRAGKVLVSGTHLSLRSTGMNRISGASVHIN